MRALSWLYSSDPLPPEMYDGAALSLEEAGELEYSQNTSRYDAKKRQELGFRGDGVA